MRTSRLNKQIKFYEISVSRDENNSETVTYVYAFTSWCEVIYLKGDKLVLNDAITETKTLQFVIRYRDTIDSSMQIEYKGSRYNIVNIPEVLGNNEMLKITAAKDVR